MRVLITGATGLIGKPLCRRLAAEGHEIVTLSRQPQRVRVEPGAKAFRWEPEEGAPGPEVWEGVEAVIHLAGEPVAAGRWTAERKRRIRESRVTGTRNLVGGIEKLSSRPKVFVSSSAVGFYGNRGDQVLTEASGPGEGFLVDVCRDWESEAARARDLGLRVPLVRTGVVLSAEGGAMEKILPPFKLGLGGRLGGGRQWFPWIHLDDIAGIICHALLTPAVAGPINGAAPGIVTNETFTKVLAAALHRPVFLPVPEFALRIAMGEMAEVVLASQRVTPKVAEETGYRFRYPQLPEALAAILK
ncbi:MAG: TIGR01777 family oxidoreductase [Blastocatellia bacterium]